MTTKGKQEKARFEDKFLGVAKNGLKITKMSRGGVSAFLKDLKTHSPIYGRFTDVHNFQGKVSGKVAETGFAKLLGIGSISQNKNRIKLSRFHKSFKIAEKFDQFGKRSQIKKYGATITRVDFLNIGSQAIKAQNNIQKNKNANAIDYGMEGTFRFLEYGANIGVDFCFAQVTLALGGSFFTVAIPVFIANQAFKSYLFTPAWDKMEENVKYFVSNLMRDLGGYFWHLDARTNTIKPLPSTYAHSTRLQNAHGEYESSFSIKLTPTSNVTSNVQVIEAANENTQIVLRKSNAEHIPTNVTTEVEQNLKQKLSSAQIEQRMARTVLLDTLSSADSNRRNTGPVHFVLNPIDAGDSRQPDLLYLGYDSRRGFGDYRDEQGPVIKGSIFKTTAKGALIFAPSLSLAIPIDISVKLLSIISLYTLPVIIGGITIKKLVDYSRWRALHPDQYCAGKIESALQKSINAHDEKTCWNNFNPLKIFSSWEDIQENRKKELESAISQGIAVSKDDLATAHEYRALSFAISQNNFEVAKKWNTNRGPVIAFFDAHIKKCTEDYTRALEAKNYDTAKNMAGQLLQWLPDAPMAHVAYALAIENQDSKEARQHFQNAKNKSTTDLEKKIVAENYVSHLWRMCETSPSQGNIQHFRQEAKQIAHHNSELRELYITSFIYDFSSKKIIDKPEEIVRGLKRLQRDYADINDLDRAKFARALYNIRSFNDSFNIYKSINSLSTLDQVIRDVCGSLSDDSEISGKCIKDLSWQLGELKKLVNTGNQNHLAPEIKEATILAAYHLSDYFTGINIQQSASCLELLLHPKLLGDNNKITNSLFSIYCHLAWHGNEEHKLEYITKAKDTYEKLSNDDKSDKTTQLKFSRIERALKNEDADERFNNSFSRFKSEFDPSANDAHNSWFLWAEIATELASEASQCGRHDEAIDILFETMILLNSNENLKQKVLATDGADQIVGQLNVNIKNQKHFKNIIQYQSCIQNNQPEQAKQYLAQIKAHIEEDIASQPSAQKHASLAYLHEYHEQNYPAATQRISLAIQMEPASAQLHIHLSRVMCRQNNYNAAAEYLNDQYEKNDSINNRQMLIHGKQAINSFIDAQVACMAAEIAVFGLQHLTRYLHSQNDMPQFCRTVAGLTAVACEVGSNMAFEILRAKNKADLFQQLNGEEEFNLNKILYDKFTDPRFIIPFIAHCISAVRSQFRPDNDSQFNYVFNRIADVADAGLQVQQTLDFGDRLAKMLFEQEGEFGFFESSMQAHNFLSNRFYCAIRAHGANGLPMYESTFIWVMADISRGVAISYSIVGIAKYYGKDIIAASGKSAATFILKYGIFGKIALALTAAGLIYQTGKAIYNHANYWSFKAGLHNGQLLVNEGHKLLRDNNASDGLNKIKAGLKKIHHELSKNISFEKEHKKSILQFVQQQKWFIHLNEKDFDLLIVDCTNFLDQNQTSDLRDDARRYRADAHLSKGDLSLAENDYRALDQHSIAHRRLASIAHVRGALHIVRAELSRALELLNCGISETQNILDELNNQRNLISYLTDTLYAFVKKHPNIASFFGMSPATFTKTAELDAKKILLESLTSEYKDVNEDFLELLKQTSMIWENFGGTLTGMVVGLYMRFIFEALNCAMINAYSKALPPPSVKKLYLALPSRSDTILPVVSAYRSIAPIVGQNRAADTPIRFWQTPSQFQPQMK